MGEQLATAKVFFDWRWARTNPCPAVPYWPWCRNADVELRQLTNDKNCYASRLTFPPGIPTFNDDFLTSYEQKFRCQNHSGTGKGDLVRYQNAPVQDWYAELQNANACGIGLDAGVQLLVLHIRYSIDVFDASTLCCPDISVREFHMSYMYT